MRGIYLLYYLGIFLFLILPNIVYYYWLSMKLRTKKIAFTYNVHLCILTQFWKFNKYPFQKTEKRQKSNKPLSYINDFTNRKYSVLYCSGITILCMHLPNNKFMYTSMYLSLLSTSSITKASVNPFWQSFFPHMRSNANCVCKLLATVLLKAVFNPIWCFLKGLAYCFKTHIHLLHSMLHSLFFSMYMHLTSI